MRNILLLRTDEMPFDVIAVQKILSAGNGFSDVRVDEPSGAVVEADYVEPGDWTIVSLSQSLSRVSLSGTSDAALRAALILQRNLGIPLRMVDTDYSFDLILRDFANLEELRAAIDNAQTR